MNSDDARCLHEKWEAYSDSTLTTVLADPDIVMTNKNDILLTDFTVQTDTAKCDSVYLNTRTYGRLFDCSDNVNFNTDKVTGLDTKTNAGIELRMVVCGNEVLSLAVPAGTDPILEYIPNENTGTTTYNMDYTTWFDLNLGP